MKIKKTASIFALTLFFGQSIFAAATTDVRVTNTSEETFYYKLFDSKMELILIVMVQNIDTW